MAQDIEQTIQKRAEPAGSKEENFDARTKEQNVAAVNTALDEWQPAFVPTINTMPPVAEYALQAIHASCWHELQQAEHATPDEYSYFKDSHFDAFITYACAATLLDATAA